MNAEDAILAHARWKTRLISYLGQPDGSINVGDLQVDNKCELGRWIYGEGKKHSALPEYATLQAAHANFHRVAAAVVKSADAGQIKETNDALGAGSDFGSASSSVINAIKTFFKIAV